MSVWAALVERLKASGHSDPLEYTPEEAVAYGLLADQRRLSDMRDAYLIARNAAHADEKLDEKFRKDLGFED